MGLGSNQMPRQCPKCGLEQIFEDSHCMMCGANVPDCNTKSKPRTKQTLEAVIVIAIGLALTAIAYFGHDLIYG
ncbi:hypothetical protein KS4_23920 [Poriferisphaera corsica]|uniref:Uncharacterized protein n=1 Tax=Poriferisphaera corsica TaxID=2528020 RepID=A0A517YVS1_9BACT|nr:hypothetical protein KS4_23920 [Poriferisphaera corsica]